MTNLLLPNYFFMATPQEMMQSMINNMLDKTGKKLEDWHAIIAEKGFEKHGEILQFLKGDHEVSHGYANTISQLFLKPEILNPTNESENEKDQALLKGKKAMAPIFKKAKQLFEGIEGEVEFAYKKSYISLRTPKKQFAMLQPSTKSRIDIGLNLKDSEVEGQIEKVGSWNSMVTHRLKVDSLETLKGIEEWLQKAYNANV